MKISEQEINNEEANENSTEYSNKIISSSDESALLPRTAISLPRLNVVFESKKSNADPTSSAKLVLSNLASGTLILSPINLAVGSHLLNSSDAKDPDAPSCSSLHGVSCTARSKKAVEARHSLPDMHSGGEAIVDDDSQLIEGCMSRSLSLDKPSDCGETRLPHKLRFKHAHRESVD